MSYLGQFQELFDAVRSRIRHWNNAPTDVIIVGGDHELPTNIETLCALGQTPIAYLPLPDEDRGEVLTISAAAVAQMARDAGLEVTPPPAEIPVVTPEAAKSLRRRYDAILVAARHHPQPGTPFADTIGWARRVFGKRAEVKHMSALCDLYECRTDRQIMTGISGSGNIVFQTLRDRICALRGYEPEAPPAIESRLGSVGISYMMEVCNAFEAHFHDVAEPGPMVPATTLRNFGKCTVRESVNAGKNSAINGLQRIPEKFALISGLPFRTHMWSNPFLTTHEVFTPEAVQFYTANRFKMVFILRHPLDVIISNAGKITEKSAGFALNNRTWFTDMLRAVELVYENLAQTRDDVSFVRYESLMADPVPEMQKLASFMGLSISGEECRPIWEEVGGKPLAAAGGGHLWDPRAGKWKEYLGRDHMELVYQSTLPKIAATFGYEMPREDFRADAYLSDDLPPPAVQAEDTTLHVAMGKTLREWPVVSTMRDERSGAELVTLKAHETIAQGVFEDPVFMTMVRGGAWPNADGSIRRGLTISDTLGL